MTKRCRICKEPFIPARPLAPCCERFECKLEYALKVSAKAKVKRLKVERTEHKQQKERLKTRSEWLKEAQTVFNQWIRLRDANLPCISCGNLTGAKMNAGHYLSVGACPELRFEQLNVHKQCEHCNSYLSGNIAKYRPRLIQKIGLENVEWLEGYHEPKKYTIDDIKQIIAFHKAGIKLLQSNEKCGIMQEI